MQVFESRPDRNRFLIAAVGVLVGFGVLYMLVRQYLPFLTDGDELRAFVDGYGVLAPLVFVVLHAAQVVVAPIPGQLTGFVSGYLFGGFLGTVYSMVGVTIGSAIAFLLSRRYGRPFVESVVRTDVVDRFDAFVDDAGLLSLFVLFLIPGFPDDVLCFVGGLTDIDIRKLIAITVVGRAPGYILVNVSGASLANGDRRLTIVLLFLLTGVSAWAYVRRDRIMDALGERQ
ncbi:TVP38/TMEM64 family protein [Halolamina litorea]|uniref:TVP38/TMEM64 family protein n=1 Tax=Halolamina litorea TaxID=1515593 RepID=A0ABD6BPY4_9EURY|nr:TVP38/TMEM64 family protein [Halolamina litorea]